MESATGVGAGGRTGIAAVTTGVLFILSIFFAPLVLAFFTSSVTSAALFMVGVLMITQLKHIDWDNLVIASSVFMTIIMMVLTYSVSLGVAWGFITYTVATIATGKYKELSWGIWVLAIVFFLYLFFGL